MNKEHQEALARVIDPESWALYDDPRMTKRPSAQSALTSESMKMAARILESGLMATHQWDRREYLQARARIIENTSRSGHCESHEDGLDGYVKHDPRCERWPDSSISGNSCISLTSSR